MSDAGCQCCVRNDDDAVGHHGVIAGIGTIPLQHGELGQMQIAALAVAKHPGELENLLFARGQQFFSREFRRGSQVAYGARAIGAGQFRARRMQMGLITGRNLQNSGFDLGKTLLVEPSPDGLGDGAPRRQKRPDVGVARRRPPGRRCVDSGFFRHFVHWG